MRARRDEEIEDEKEERREDETAAKGAHFNGSGANKCRDETRVTRARARDAGRDARETHDVRMAVRHCHRHTARALSSERAPPPSQRARVGSWGEEKRR